MEGEAAPAPSESLRLAGPRARKRRGGWVGVAAAASVLVTPTGALGQASFEVGGVHVAIGAWLHVQAVTSSAEGAKPLDFFNRRARFTLDASVTPFFDARIQPDFGGGTLALQDAYVRLSFHPSVRLWMGQFKRAFDLFELDSPSEVVAIEPTGRIDGVAGCAGVGSVCSLSRLTERLRYSSRDVGLKLDGALGSRMRYQATLTNGTGIQGPDHNPGKSAAGRLSLDMGSAVSVSANVSHHDELVDGATVRGTAYGLDMEVGGFRDGTHLQVGVVGGDNWLLDRGAGSPDFVAAQVIASRYVPISNERFEAVEPLLRVSWADAHTGQTAEDAWLFTPGVFLYVRGRNRVGTNLDIYAPASGGTETGLKVQVYFHF